MLPSDQMGRKGEAYFRLLCADSGLTCNPSTEDRTGWDFLVEFPFDTRSAAMTLDKRPRPISCHIQVKTLHSKNDRIRLRLTAAEWLAKEIKPSFIYVLKVDAGNLEPVGAYLIHIFDGALAKILQRLRKAQCDGTANVNHVFMDFYPSREGVSIPITGQALRSAVETWCGADQQGYVHRKEDQLKKLGFGLRPIGFQFTLQDLSENDLVEGFLGRIRMKASDMKLTETRFGLELPFGAGDAAEGVIEIRPDPADECKMFVRLGDQLESIATFEGEVICPALSIVKKENFRFLVRNRFFEFFFTSGGVSISTLQNQDGSDTYTLCEWINFLRFLQAISQGGARIILQFGKIPPSTLGLDIDRDAPNSPLLTAEQYGAYIDILERAKGILDLIGAGDETTTMDRIFECQRDIIGLSKIFLSGYGEGSMRLTIPKAIMPAEALRVDLSTVGEQEFAIFGYAEIAGRVFGYCVQAEMTVSDRDDHLLWQSRKTSPKDIVPLPNFPDGFDSFVDRMRAAMPGKSTAILGPVNA